MSNRELAELLKRLERFEESLGRMRQYIGARYVPTYYQNSLDPTSSEWEANVNYDPLTIVSLPNMHSYQSKKFVPSTIGSPASNPEYWYDQGYASAYYQALQDQIDDINDGTVPGSLQNQIDEMKDGTISGSLQDQINDNASDIATLKNSHLLSAKILFVGDSWGSPSGSFINNVISNLGLDATNLAVSGAGFTKGVNNNGFLDQITQYAGNRNEIDAIIVLGGLNDSTQANYNTPATLQNGISDFVTYANTNYPNATLYLGYIGNGLDGSTDISTTYVYEYRRAACYEYNRNRNFVNINMFYELCILKDCFDAGGAHPSATGQTILTKALSDYIKGGHHQTFLKNNSLNLSASGICTALSGSATYLINEGLTEIAFSDNYAFTIANGSTINQYTAELAESAPCWFNVDVDIVCSVLLNNFDGISYQVANAVLRFTHNKLNIKVFEIASGGSSYKTFTAGANAKIYLMGRSTKTFDTLRFN